MAVKWSLVRRAVDAVRSKWGVTSLLLLLTLSVSGGLLWYQVWSLREKKIDKISQIPQYSDILIKSATKIRDWYQMGNYQSFFPQGQFNCPLELSSSHPLNLDVNYYRCNPSFLECVLNQLQGIVPVTHLEKKYAVQVERVGKMVQRYSNQRRHVKIISLSSTKGVGLPAYGVMLRLHLADYSLQFILEDSCHDTYLPQRIYAYSSSGKKGKKVEWDNFQQQIYVDKFLVTNRDIIEWVDFAGGPKELVLSDDRDEWYRPAIDLDLETRQKFCAFRGKQLLSANIYQAATFLPGDIKNSRPQKIINYPYPWTIRKKRSFLYRFNAEKLNKKKCGMSFVKECSKLMSYKFYSSSSTSWVQMNQILGGYMETFYNPIEKEKNLKYSSMKLAGKSKWHQLGMLASMNTSLKGVGFRCFKYVNFKLNL